MGETERESDLAHHEVHVIAAPQGSVYQNTQEVAERFHLQHINENQDQGRLSNERTDCDERKLPQFLPHPPQRQREQPQVRHEGGPNRDLDVRRERHLGQHNRRQGRPEDLQGKAEQQAERDRGDPQCRQMVRTSFGLPLEKQPLDRVVQTEAQYRAQEYRDDLGQPDYPKIRGVQLLPIYGQQQKSAQARQNDPDAVDAGIREHASQQLLLA